MGLESEGQLGRVELQDVLFINNGFWPDNNSRHLRLSVGRDHMVLDVERL